MTFPITCERGQHCDGLHHCRRRVRGLCPGESTIRESGRRRHADRGRRLGPQPLHRHAGRLFQLMKTGQIDWGYHTEPQEHLAGRRLFWPRAKVLGGCSCVNGMIYIRGSATDYDHGRRWEIAVGPSGIAAYFLRAENWNGPRSPIHGHDGPLHTSRYGVHHPLSKAFVEAGVQAGYPYRDDFNGGEQEGFGPATARSRPSKTRESARARLLLTCIR